MNFSFGLIYNKMKKNLFFFTLLGAMMSCGSTQQTNEGNNANTFDSSVVVVEEGTAAVDERPVSIEEISGKWMVKEANKITVAEGDTSVFVILNIAESQMNASAGCNSIFGEIGKKGRTAAFLAFNNTGCTRMMCQDRDEIERALIEALNNTRSFRLSSGVLNFRNEHGDVVLFATK